MVPSHIFITDLDPVRCSQAVLCSLECEAKEEELMGIDMLLLNEKGVLRFVGVIKSTFSDHEQSAQCIMVDFQGDRYEPYFLYTVFFFLFHPFVLNLYLHFNTARQLCV
ncbi:unnamed protein product [Brassica oleracea var. botrytis]|uniref:(rape) hypothetical protein n=1 Tax=Brassica napus TaxID=3708 RepID=A0A816K3L1_BRANA|nr:hypothetical protein HID58_046075 [Brassica napus]CAF1892827.1 unnamed protein product [Brassica napus]